MRLKLRKSELIIFLGIVVLALFCWFFMRKEKESQDYGSIRITVNGKDFGVYSLGEDQKIDIGDTNTCRIQDGQAKMIEATCPDHICIQQLPIDENGGMIVCLPNGVIIEGIAAESSDTGSELDGFTG